MNDRIIETAKMVAGIRAIETQREDGLFVDHLAMKLAGGEEIIAKITPGVQKYEKMGIPIIPVRTRYFDDFLMSLVANIKQVVILKASLDTRAFRLDFPSETHVYELERKEIIDYKESILKDEASKCHRHTIATDMKDNWVEKLINTGYENNIPSIWLLEGVLSYLEESDVHSLLSKISELSCFGSWLGCDNINKKMLNSDDPMSKLWNFGCDSPEDLLDTYGWEASVVQPGDETAHYNRFTRKSPPRDIDDVVRSFLIKARKR